jgi:tRNA (guanine-N7-)-methyltransferase
MDWSTNYPQYYGPEATITESTPKVEFADLGCGYGGLLIALATLFPEKLMLGMEIRKKVEDYVHNKIIALRQNHPGQYQNCSIIRMNAMKFLPNYFEKAQVTYTFAQILLFIHQYSIIAF